MSASKLICLLVLLSIAFASAQVNDLMKLHREASLIQDQMDAILERTKVSPLSRLHEGPMAPRATTKEELAQEVPIAHYGGRGQSPLLNEPLVAQGISLMEQRASTNVDMANTVAATLVSWPGGPNLDLPAPEEPVYQGARKQFHATKPSDIELRLRKLWPRPIDLTPPAVQTADMYLNANEILPKDPDADVMLNHFNDKYGVFDDNGIPSKLPTPPDSELLPRNDQNMTSLERDYSSVYDAANKFGFDIEKDSIQNFDKMLSDMWVKRWEYMASEKSRLEDAEKARQNQDENMKTFPIDPLFPAIQANKDDNGDALLGNVYTFQDKETAPLPTIPNRKDFKPDIHFYGPRVNGKAIDVAFSQKTPQVPTTVAPEYIGEPEVVKQSIKLIPMTPEAVDLEGTINPDTKGLDFDALNAVPAVIADLSKLMKKK